MANLIKKYSSRLWVKLLLILMVIGLAVTFYLDTVIRSTFTDKKWSVPSTVYARPLELYQGAALTLADLKTELGLLGYHFVSQIDKPGQALINAKQVNIFTPGFQFSDELEPARRIELSLDDGMVSRLVTDDGASLVRLDPVVIGGIYPSHN